LPFRASGGMIRTMLTAEDWAYIDAQRQPAAPTPQAPQQSQQGFFERAGKQLYNLPNNIGSAIGETVAAGLDLATGKPQILREADARERQADTSYLGYENYALPQAQGFAQKALDIGAAIGAELPGVIIPAGGVARGARLLGASSRIAPVIGDVAAGALSGYRDNASEAGLQATEFGVDCQSIRVA